MSNFLAVAAVTASLKRVLDEALAAGVPGAVPNATVTTTRPESVDNGAGERKGINVYLYQVTPNTAWRNEDLPTRRPDGTLVQRPTAAIDLHYLLTFYGDEGELEPQRLLGMAVRTLNARPVLTRAAVTAAVSAAVDDDPATFLQFADLGDAIESVKLSPLPLNLEELSKLWSVFFQTPYVLSAAYQGTVVLIESDETPRRGLPVRDRRLYVMPFRNPVVDDVVSAAGVREPILAGSTLRVRGSRLVGDVTRVRIGALEVAPDAATARDEELRVALPATLQAGVHGLQVVHLVSMGEPALPHPGFESNVAALVLRPTVVTPVTAAAGDDPGTVDVTVELDPPVGVRQRVSLLLDEAEPPDDRAPRAYRFDAPGRDVEGAPESSPTVTVTVAGVEAGVYLVRVHVDGAESPLETDADGRFAGPTVTVP